MLVVPMEAEEGDEPQAAGAGSGSSPMEAEEESVEDRLQKRIVRIVDQRDAEIRELRLLADNLRKQRDRWKTSTTREREINAIHKAREDALAWRVGIGGAALWSNEPWSSSW